MSLVEQYRTELYEIIDNVKNCLVKEKHKAELIFTTGHKAKGLEYDVVKLTDDFIDTDGFIDSLRTIRSLTKEAAKPLIQMLKESVNILYVVSTRTKNKLEGLEIPFDTGVVEEDDEFEPISKEEDLEAIS